MQRFYFDIELWKPLSLDDKDFFNQISHVMRSKIGDKIILFSWDGFEYIYSIDEISKKWIKLVFDAKEPNEADPKLKINLYQSLPNKYEKIEYILQKWVETWISRFVFFPSERSSRLAITDKKIARFNAIIKEALEQCWWNVMPTLEFLDKFDSTLIHWNAFVCHTTGDDSKWISFDNSEETNLLIWPEGWFSKNEIDEFSRLGFGFMNFWKRVLRKESASSVISFLLINAHDGQSGKWRYISFK